MTVVATIAAIVLVAGTLFTVAEDFTNIVNVFLAGMTKASKVNSDRLANVNWETAFATK